MKIAIIGPAYPYRGGIANFSERLAYELQLEQDDVQLFTFNMMYPNFLFPGKTQYAESVLQFPLEITQNINSINPFNWWRVGRYIQKQNFDLIIIPYSIPFLAPSLGFIARIIKRNNFTKVLSIVHNLHPHEKRFGDKFLSNFFLKSCDAFLTLSLKVKEDILGIRSNAKVIVSNHPIYDTFGTIIEKQKAKNQLNLEESKQYILFFGLVRAYKGLDILIDAMSIVAPQNPNIQLLIAGEFYGDYPKYLAQIEALNLSERIVVINQFVPEDKVNSYFCAADIVVQPYKNATQSGITQICYHFNKPMIVTNVGALAENVVNNHVGFVCEPSKETVAASILRFYQEEKEVIFIENIKEEKKKYSWRVLSQQIRSVFK